MGGKYIRPCEDILYKAIYILSDFHSLNEIKTRKSRLTIIGFDWKL